MEEVGMERSDLVLAVLAAGDGAAHTPVQVQKLLFLVDRRVASGLAGPFFDFQPYFYGPFDRQVYGVLEDLARQGKVEICLEGPLRAYRLTRAGQDAGIALLKTMDAKVAAYIRSLSAIVRKMTFGELVSAVYRAYPEMKENSVFQTAE